MKKVGTSSFIIMCGMQSTHAYTIKELQTKLSEFILAGMAHISITVQDKPRNLPPQNRRGVSVNRSRAYG